MPTEIKLPFRPDWYLAENLRAQGFDVNLAVTRADGAELSDADRRTIRAAVVALAAHDAEVYRDFVKANVARGKAHKATEKGAKRKAAKRPPR